MRRFFFVLFTAALSFPSLFLIVFPANAAPTTCVCYCGSKEGAVQPKGFENVQFDSCEKACETLKLKVVACAETAENLPSGNPRCFSKSECALQSGEWDEAYQPPECLNGAHYCYPITKPFTLAYSIGGTKQVLHIGDFVNSFYQYLIIAAFTIAIVVMIVGGFQYVLSAGGFGDVKKAKERIKNAIIGFVLLLLIGLILQTINPQISRLAPLSLPMLKRSNFTFGFPADTPGVGRGCNKDSDCNLPYKCLGAKRDSKLEGLLEKTAYAAAGVTSIALVGAGGVATGVKAVVRFVGKHYYISSFIGVGAATFTWTYNGFCGAEANHNVQNGGFCGEDKHCASNNCAILPGLAMGSVGVCTSGQKGSACACALDSESGDDACGSLDCEKDTDGNRMQCIKTGIGVIRQCGSTTGAVAWGEVCNDSFRCADPFTCRSARCLKEEQPIGSTCKDVSECARDPSTPYACVGPESIRCDTVDYCVCQNERTTGAPCFDTRHCTGSCNGADPGRHIPGTCS